MRYRTLILVFSSVIWLGGTGLSQDLSPGDGIKLTFYNISDALSGDFFIQQSGDVQLPYIGLIPVSGRSFESVRAEIKHKYKKIYRNPELVVQPLFRVNVLGEVQRPGVFYVTGVERLSDLLALAGGETRDANLNKIYLIRNQRKMDINAGDILLKGQRLKDFGLRSNDQIYVSRKRVVGLNNASVIVSAGAVLLTAVALFARR